MALSFFCYKCQGMFCETKYVNNPSRYLCPDCHKKYSHHGKAGDSDAKESSSKKEVYKEADAHEAGRNTDEAVLKPGR